MYERFNPRAMSDFFAKLEKEGGVGARPSVPERSSRSGKSRGSRLEGSFTLGRKTSYRADSAEFRDIKQRVGG